MTTKKSIGKVLILILALTFTLISHAAIAEEIVIVGTGDGTRVLESIGAAFSRTHSGVTVSVPKSIGSGGGIKAVGNDLNKIGRIARSIKEKEKKFGLSDVPFAKVPVVFYVHKGSGVKNLSAKQICDIYSGKVTDWQELGGKKEKIRVVRREDGDSSLALLQKTFPGFKEIVLTGKSKTALKTDEAISIVESKKGSIGFGPLDVVSGADVDILQVDGTNPTDPGYPSITTLSLIYKSKNKHGNLGSFIDFAASAASRQAIEEANGLPVN